MTDNLKLGQEQEINEPSTPEECKDFVMSRCTVENWQRIQHGGKYYRKFRLERKTEDTTWAIEQLVEDKSKNAESQFWLNAYRALSSAIKEGIV